MSELNSDIENRIRNTLDEHIRIWDGRRKRHGYMNNVLVVFTIALSASITTAGIFDQGKLAGVLGAILTGLLALQQAFPFADMSFFYRVGVAEGTILRLNLDTKADTKEEVETLEIKVETLIRKMAQDIPRGQAIHDAVQNMHKEVREAA